MNEKKQGNVRSVVFTGFFAAIVFLGIQSFRIPMPAAVVYGVLNVVLDFVWTTVELVIAGSSVMVAATAVIGSIPATVINSGFMVIGVAVLYWPVRNVVTC